MPLCKYDNNIHKSFKKTDLCSLNLTTFYCYIQILSQLTRISSIFHDSSTATFSCFNFCRHAPVTTCWCLTLRSKEFLSTPKHQYLVQPNKKVSETILWIFMTFELDSKSSLSSDWTKNRKVFRWKSWHFCHRKLFFPFSKNFNLSHMCVPTILMVRQCSDLQHESP